MCTAHTVRCMLAGGFAACDRTFIESVTVTLGGIGQLFVEFCVDFSNAKEKIV